jgi:hypothetical protein
VEGAPGGRHKAARRLDGHDLGQPLTRRLRERGGEGFRRDK